MLSNTLLAALAASASAVSADTVMGFNYASTANDQAAFEASLKAAAGLKDAPGFNSARLYTMIQDKTDNMPISAIPAAISQGSTLLLGLWASGGQAAFDNEITALKSAIKQYGKKFADTVVGISVGSEDLYRITYTSQVVNKDPNPGAEPDTLVSYIKQVRAAIKGTVLADKPVGHVDTYTAYINGSNQNVIDNLDFLGMDAYPYYQTTQENGIDNAADLFFSAYDQTKSAGAGKPVWVTETGWPYSGKVSHLGIASKTNAETYWQEVGCALFGKTNVWWYTLADGTANPAFGVLGNSISNQPVYSLSCKNSTRPHSSNPSKTGSKTHVASATASYSGKPVKTTGVPNSPSGGESSSPGSGSSGSGNGAGYGGNGTVSTAPASPTSTFAGAANRHAEVGGFAMAVLGALAYIL